MENAIKEKNVENYMKCLVDSSNRFQFIPDQYEASNNVGVFEHWNLPQEQSYINKLFTSTPDDSLRSLMFSNLQTSEFPDSVLIRTDYTIEVHHIRAPSYPRLGKGEADFWFIRRNGYWVITRWIDFETKSEPTALRVPSWSSIKASFMK